MYAHRTKMEIESGYNSLSLSLSLLAARSANRLPSAGWSFDRWTFIGIASRKCLSEISYLIFKFITSQRPESESGNYNATEKAFRVDGPDFPGCGFSTECGMSARAPRLPLNRESTGNDRRRGQATFLVFPNLFSSARARIVNLIARNHTHTHTHILRFRTSRAAERVRVIKSVLCLRRGVVRA